MFKNLYAIFDTVAEVYNNPFTDINNQSAIRAFSTSVKEQPHKNDYVLYHIGAFDDNSGLITADKNPVRLYSGIEVKTDNVTELPEMLKKQSGEN